MALKDSLVTPKTAVQCAYGSFKRGDLFTVRPGYVF